MNEKIPLFYPYIPKEKILKEIENTLDGRWLGQGPKVNLFEKKFGELLLYKYPLFVNSGTSALELAYHLIGIKAGDEVIVPILDCTAGQMALKRSGVNIIFADIDDNLNIDPNDVAKKITNKTKAVVGVHLGGIPFNPELNKLCKEKNIPLIVDAAQHHEHCEGDYICYSFQAIKHITTCDGGMLVLNNENEYKRAKLLRWFGIDRESKEKNDYQAWKKREMTFDVYEPGFKMQPTDIDACFGLAALDDLKSIIDYRKKLSYVYKKNLPKQCKPISGGSCWLFGILTDERDGLAEYLTDKNIDNNLVHLRNDIYSVFGGQRQNLPKMNELEDKYLYLPLNTKVTEQDVLYICGEIKKFYEYRIKKD
jgi:dTDP-4-amino-4,6-dideoxygalactose transaminase